MDKLISLVKMLVKLVLLFIGGLMLFGGGMCALFGVGSGGMGTGLIFIVGIAAVVALVGWGLIVLANSIGKQDADTRPTPYSSRKEMEQDITFDSQESSEDIHRTHESKSPSWVWPALIVVALCVSIGLAVLQSTLDHDEQKRRAAQNASRPASPVIHVPAAVGAAPPITNNSPPVQVAACQLDVSTLPSDYRIYAAGAYAGREVNFQIDQSGHQATQIDVVVNQPNKPVALMLGAYEPTIWNVSWTQGTNIVAVFVSGYHRQTVSGLSNSIPTLISSYDNKGACGYFYVSSEDDYRINPMSRKLFGKDADMIYPASNGKVVIGKPISTGMNLQRADDDPSVESFRDTKAPLAGSAGLEEAVRYGLIRPATQQDAEAWAETVATSAPKRDVPPVAGQASASPRVPNIYRGYVVLKPFFYPAGLYGANLATFFILKGVPRPKGNPGHSAIYDFNDMACVGALCGH